MRDNKKSREYFLEQINVFNDSIKEIESMIQFGKVAEDRINFMKRLSVGDTINIIRSHYSAGSELTKLRKPALSGIQLIYESWDGFWKAKSGNPKGGTLNQYLLDGYDEMLWMLSLGYLLDIEDKEFQKLVDVIDRDQVKDHLFEFIIRAKLPERKPLEEESYREHFGVPDVFETLREAIKQTDKEKAQGLTAQFIKKEWYPKHKDAGWYNSHKSKHNTYFGYWSFETAAVVVLLGLDDSSFRDSEYYPKDLVDYYRQIS